MNKRIYVCSQYGSRGDIDSNLDIAALACQRIFIDGDTPICPHLFYARVLNDQIAGNRETGIKVGLELLRDCEELQVWSRVSNGMRTEILLADSLNIPVTIGDMEYLYSADLKAEKIMEIAGDIEHLRGSD